MYVPVPLSPQTQCRPVPEEESWEADRFLGIIFRSVLTHAFRVVIFTQGPKLCQDTPSQRVSHKTLFQRIRLREARNEHRRLQYKQAFKDSNGRLSKNLAVSQRIKKRRLRQKRTSLSTSQTPASRCNLEKLPKLSCSCCTSCYIALTDLAAYLALQSRLQWGLSLLIQTLETFTS